jgi:hypothetical protein
VDPARVGVDMGAIAGELADATGTFAQCNEALVLEFRDEPLPYEQ